MVESLLWEVCGGRLGVWLVGRLLQLTLLYLWGHPHSTVVVQGTNGLPTVPSALIMLETSSTMIQGVDQHASRQLRWLAKMDVESDRGGHE